MPSCSAIYCTSTHEKGFRMFCFPQEETRRKQWIQNVGRKNWNPTRSSRLCELHFEASQFENYRLDGARKIKPNAVPTLFHFFDPPTESVNEQTRIDLDSDSNIVPNREDFEEIYRFINGNSSEMEDSLSYKIDFEEIQYELIQCNHCSLTSLTYEEWKMHIMQSHCQLNNAEVYEQIFEKIEGTIDNNNVDFETGTSLDSANTDREIFTATDGDDSKFACKSCYFTTKNQHYLSAHRQMYHKTVKETHYFCPQPNCHFESQYRRNFRRHLLKTHKIDEKTFQLSNENAKEPIDETLLTCKICYFKTARSDILSLHQQLLHSVWLRSETDPFWCPMQNCTVTSLYKTNFKRHLIRVHRITMDELGIAEYGSGFGLRHEVASNFEEKGKCKFAFETLFKTRNGKPMEVEENKVSNREINVTKSEYKCSQVNSDEDFGLFWRAKFSCPFEDCSYVIRKRSKFKKHLALFHNLNDFKLKNHKGIDYFIAKYAKTFNCLKCNFEGIDMKELKDHFCKKHRITIKNRSKAKSAKKNSKVSKHFLLKCSQCRFATNLKSSARLHGLQHIETNKKHSVVFHNYINYKQRQRDLEYFYPNRNVLKCPKCDFRALIARHLTRHILNFHPPKSTNRSSISNIKITKQRLARRRKLRQINKKITDKNEQELCKILVTQNEFINNEVIEIVFVDDSDEQANSNSENSFTCTICEKLFLCKSDLLVHIDTEHILVPKNLARFNTGIKRKVSFICSLCKQVLFSTTSLKNHTNIHAKAAKDPNLKVTFMKFKGDCQLNNVTIKADLNNILRQSIRAKDGLNYNPNLEVFSCEECNFKSNQAESLAKHKKLHWSKEKEEVYKSKKWFTCQQCSYFSFDAEKLEEHTEMHKRNAKLGLYIDLLY